MLKRIAFSIVAACLLALVPPAVSADKRLTGGEIQMLLTGISVVYEDGGQQFFAAGGDTTYRSATGKEEHGSWRVSGDLYCSAWEAGKERCYEVTREGDTIRWGNLYPAKIIKSQ